MQHAVQTSKGGGTPKPICNPQSTSWKVPVTGYRIPRGTAGYWGVLKGTGGVLNGTVKPPVPCSMLFCTE